MLLHTVLIRPKSNVSDAELAGLAEQTKSIAARLCGGGTYHVGPNSTQEPLDQGYAFGFILQFPDREALGAYHHDAEHDLLSKRIQELAETVLVFDLET